MFLPKLIAEGQVTFRWLAPFTNPSGFAGPTFHSALIHPPKGRMMIFCLWQNIDSRYQDTGGKTGERLLLNTSGNACIEDITTPGRRTTNIHKTIRASTYMIEAAAVTIRARTIEIAAWIAWWWIWNSI